MMGIAFTVEGFSGNSEVFIRSWSKVYGATLMRNLIQF